MSALGQKQTFAPQNTMSALPPIATVKADSRKRSCLLCSRKQTCAVQLTMSALGQKQTSSSLSGQPSRGLSTSPGVMDVAVKRDRNSPPIAAERMDHVCEPTGEKHHKAGYRRNQKAPGSRGEGAAGMVDRRSRVEEFKLAVQWILRRFAKGLDVINSRPKTRRVVVNRIVIPCFGNIRPGFQADIRRCALRWLRGQPDHVEDRRENALF